MEPSASGTFKLLSQQGRPVTWRSPGEASAQGTAVPGADAHGATDLGRRRTTNEDQFLVAQLERSMLVETSSFSAGDNTALADVPQGRLFMVADGVGGRSGGEIASAVAIDAMAYYAFALMPWVSSGMELPGAELSEGLRDAMREAQDRIRRVARRKGVDPRLGTTLTMAYVTWPRAHLVHVGDSRAYLLREGALQQLTRDHTVAQELVDQDAMTATEAKASRFSHILANAMGGSTDDLQVDFLQIDLRSRDQLLLCTDGLTRHLEDGEIAEYLAQDEPAERVVDRMIAVCNERGGLDNITAILARF